MATSKLTLEERFWSKVDKSGDCWLWTACKNPFGYGHFQQDGRPKVAHRVSYELAFGSIAEGLRVLHRCDVPSCVNPTHLFLGTNKDNTADMIKKGRKARTGGELNGCAKLTSDQVQAIRCDPRTHWAIAADYGIHRNHVHRLRRGARWKHLPVAS